MQPRAANQAARQQTQEKKWTLQPYDLKPSAEKVAAQKQRFASRVPAPSPDFPSQEARAPSESVAAAIAHEPLHTPQGFPQRSLPPAPRPAERPNSCLRR